MNGQGSGAPTWGLPAPSPPPGIAWTPRGKSTSAVGSGEVLPHDLRLRLGPKGTTVVPLDGAARSSGRTRAPARGVMAEPPSPRRVRLSARLRSVARGTEREEATSYALKREEGTVKMELGFQGHRPRCAFDHPRRADDRQSQMKG